MSDTETTETSPSVAAATLITEDGAQAVAALSEAEASTVQSQFDHLGDKLNRLYRQRQTAQAAADAAVAQGKAIAEEIAGTLSHLAQAIAPHTSTNTPPAAATTPAE